MRPVFMTDNLVDTGYGKKVGADQTHLKITVTQGGRGVPIGGIGFGLGDKHDLITHQKPFKAAYVLDENEWRDQVSLQLQLKDIQ